LPLSNDLAGKELVLKLVDDDRETKFEFLSFESLTWSTKTSTKASTSKTATYEAICIAPEIYFVDFVDKSSTNTSVSLILDFRTKKATVVTARIPGITDIKFSFLERLGKDADLSSIQIEIKHAMISPFPPGKSTKTHERSQGLIGKRIMYTYGRDRIYEHIYLNERFYSWHCLKGAEAGLGDTDSCDYFKIAPDIYLFIWREKIMPTFGLVLINLKEMRSNGKTCGLDIATGKYLNFTMGATAKFLNQTYY
jgi:hypothetical protein